MTSKSLESCSEIEGARHLLKVAQKWSNSSSAMLKIAQDELGGAPPGIVAVVEFAKSQVLNSSKEVKDAEAYLKEVERRWEVIDIEDEEVPSKTNDGVGNNGNATMENVNNCVTPIKQFHSNADDDVIVISVFGDDGSSGGGSSASISSAGERSLSGVGANSKPTEGATSENNAAIIKGEVMQSDALISESDFPYHVTLQGCAISDVNGIYTLVGLHNNAPKSSKTNPGRCVISHLTLQCETTMLSVRRRKALGGDYVEELKRWLVVEPGSSNHFGGDFCYYSARADDSSRLPPMKWKTTSNSIEVKGGYYDYRGRGRFPAPQLSHGSNSSDVQNFFNDRGMVNELLVEGCGTKDINGTYTKKSHFNKRPSYFKIRSSDGLPCA